MAALAREGAGATLLIHEATFANDLAAMAEAKKHSTVGGALAAGDAMVAWRVIVTHLSQRYSKAMPDVLAQGAGCSQRASAAFDGMRVRFSELPALPALTPALMALLADAE